jgi:microcystin-dependent protein
MTALKTFLDNALAALVTVQRGDPAGISSPSEGMLIWDTTGATDILKRYTVAGGWISLYSCNITTGAVVPYKDGSPMTVTPAGCMSPFAGSTAPTGWLLCYGQAVSRTTYATLFGVISTTYGVGDGSTTFNLPDMRGRGFIGLDNLGGSAASRVAAATSLGDTGGSETHTHTGPSHTHTTGDVTLTAAQSGCPAHNHPGNVSNTAGSLNGVNAGISGINGAYITGNNTAANASQAHNHGATAAGGTGNTSTVSNLTPYMAGGWIIKY